MHSLLTLSPLVHRSACAPGFASGECAPAVDVIERADDYVVRLDAPGYTKDQLSISVENNKLEIRGDRDDDAPENETYLRRERRSNGFIRTFNLGRRADANQVSASFENGVLEVRVPKAEEAKSRQIPVTTQS